MVFGFRNTRSYSIRFQHRKFQEIRRRGEVSHGSRRKESEGTHSATVRTKVLFLHHSMNNIDHVTHKICFSEISGHRIEFEFMET